MKSLSSPVAKAPVPATLYVCLSCWRQGEKPASEDAAPTDGKRLFDALMARLDELGTQAPVRAIPVLCFANCERGCSIAVSSPGKWSYLLGELGPEHASDLLAYAEAYNRSATGVVLPSGRPSSLQKSVIGRFPAHLEPMKDAAE